MRRRSIAIRTQVIAAASFLVTLPFELTSAVADEGGVSFWLPGQFGSLAAAPQQPGWSFADAYYHTTVNGGAMSQERESLSWALFHGQQWSASMPR